MAQRKLQQEIDKCFKQVDIGVEGFDSLYEKYEQSSNSSQRDKLVDSLKTQCKKLQRLRDQIKTWAAGNEVKDKGPLLEKRELIESKMEAFKEVERTMKTKMFSKEGLSMAAKLDPKEQEKEDMKNFLGETVDRLNEQVERLEAESEQLQAQTKKSKKDSSKAERAQELGQKTERHKWHVKQLELLLRLVENETVEPEQVKEVEESIKDYVDNNEEVNFMEDETMYDEFNLDQEGDRYGVHQEIDRTMSHEAGVSEDAIDMSQNAENTKPKGKSASDGTATGRRPSQHIKSPMPILANLQSLPNAAPAVVAPTMKPALPPAKPPGEILKYASAAAAAAATASDMSGIGIAPLPPPTSKTTVTTISSVPSNNAPVRPSPTQTVAAPIRYDALNDTKSTTSASASTALRDEKSAGPASRSPIPSISSFDHPSPAVSSSQPVAVIPRDDVPETYNGATDENDESSTRLERIAGQNHDRKEGSSPGPVESILPGQDAGVVDGEDEAIYHLPANLQELVDSYEAVRKTETPVTHPDHQKAFAASFNSRPTAWDAERPTHYQPRNPAPYTPPHYPQEPLAIFNDPRLYSRVDTDSLFYSFYFRQGTYQQYLAAKTLKNQSWRFHKQYQTWFQRHEEPKSITDEYERGTYRFFDYEATWMNRRKGDFQFIYKFLEDEL